MTTNQVVRERILNSTDKIRKNVEHLDNLIEVLKASGVVPVTVMTVQQIANAIYKENDSIGLSAAAMEVK